MNLRPRQRLHVTVPLSGAAPGSGIAFSPDGRSVVMNYDGEYGIRSLETGEIRMLKGLTSGALVGANAVLVGRQPRTSGSSGMES